MAHPARRSQRRRQQALPRLHRRQSGLAEPRDVPPPSRGDHKARMEKRLFALDHEAALRAARRLGAADLAIAQARIAINRKVGNAKKLLDAVPTDARNDPGYIFAKVHLLRHDNKMAEA